MKKKILLAVLTVVILLGAVIAYAYFATDAFRTEKEMFFSYILTDDMLKNLQDEKVTEYVQKQHNTPFSNKGEISLNFVENEAEDQSLAMLNNSKITLEGKTDVSKKLSEQTLSMNFAQAFTIPVNLKMDGEAVGLQSGFLNSKFIAVRNENLKALFQKFGLETEEVPNKIEFSKEEFTEEETQALQDKYLTILNENLEEELFSKEKLDNQKVLTLKMPQQKLIDILVKILETARNDELLLSKMSAIYEKEEIQSEIDEMINDLKNVETSEKNTFEMKLYVESKNIVKIEIATIKDNKTTMNAVIENIQSQIKMKLYEESELVGELNISKEVNEVDPTYNMVIKLYDEVEGNIEIALKIQYKNLSTLNNVEENYEIKMLYNGTEMMIKYNNLTNFNESLEIEGLNENNAIILNDATEQELQNLMITIYQNLGLMQ